MDFISEDQVIGGVAPPARGAAPAAKSPFVSETEVVGGSPADAAARADASSLWGRTKAAVAPYVDAASSAFDFQFGPKGSRNVGDELLGLPFRRRASDVAGGLLQAADMITGTLTGAARTAAFPTLAATFNAMGADTKTAATAAKMLLQDKIPEEVNAPYRKIAESLGQTKLYEDNPVGYVLEWLGKGITKAGAKTEKVAGIPSEWIEQGAEGVMSWLGLKGVKGAVKAHDAFYRDKAFKEASAAGQAAKDDFIAADQARRADDAGRRAEAEAAARREPETVVTPEQAYAAKQGAKYVKAAETADLKDAAAAQGKDVKEIVATPATLKDAFANTLTPEEAIAASQARIASAAKPHIKLKVSPEELRPIVDRLKESPGALTPEEQAAAIKAGNALGFKEGGAVSKEALVALAVASGGIGTAIAVLPALYNYLNPGANVTWSKAAKEIERRVRKRLEDRQGEPANMPRAAPEDETLDEMPNAKPGYKGETLVDAGLAGVGVAGMVLGKKGMPHPALVSSLSERIWGGRIAPEFTRENAPIKLWADKAVSRFLQKPKNELADVEVPFGEGTKPLGRLLETALMPRTEAVAIKDNMPVREDVWRLADTSEAGLAVKSYLSHVGDYLAEHVSPEKLPQYDLVRAVRETQKWDRELASKMEKAHLDDTKGSPVYKDYGDGVRWVQLTKPGQFARESDAMGHSVRGYEPSNTYTTQQGRHAVRGEKGVTTPRHPDWIPASGDSGHPSYGLGGWEAIKSGEAKIYSLRDAKGESHATVEVGDIKDSLGQGPELVIKQIKGKQNRAPAARYLPYVQDFVKGGKWGEVGDIQHTGMDYYGPESFHVKEGGGKPGYYTPEEMAKLEGMPIGNGREATAAAGQELRNHIARNQRGKIDPKLLAGIAAVSGGAALGAYLDPEHPIHGAILGAGAGAIATRINPRAIGETLKQLATAKPLVKIDDLARETVYARRVVERETYKLSSAVEKAVPNAARREAIWRHLDGDETIKLSPVEAKAAADVRAFYAAAGAEAKKAGVVRELIDDYATRIYGEGAKDWIRGKVVGSDTSLESPFGKKRAYPTLAEAQAAGHEPLTLDVSRVMEAYSRSVTSAIENKKFVQTLREAKAPGGETPLLAKEGKAPPDYVFVDHPQLRGLRVHPDIAGDLRFIFDAKEVGPIIRTLDAINTTQKRMAVSFSLFHAAALEHAMLGATAFTKSSGRGLRVLGQAFAPAIFGENLAVKMVREGGAGDLVDQAMKAGVQFGLERQSPALPELKSGFYEGMQAATKFLDDTIPQLGTQTVGRFVQLNHMFDRAMWGRFHTAMKLETFGDKVAELDRNNARAAEAGKAELKSQEEIGRMAASFTNDVFGGLDWHGLVQEMSSRWGRELASAMFSPSGRLGMRMLMFAPDWTISTTRAFVKAFGQRGVAGIAGGVAGSQLDPENATVGGLAGLVLGYGAGRAAGLKETTSSGVGGLLRPQELADLHRQYLMRSALIYSVVVDALNVQMSGHHFWENKDPTRLDRGDGTTQQVSKHFMEPMHWLLSPRQQAMNKLSYVVKEPLAQLQDVEYLSTHGAPRMGNVDRGESVPLGARVKHALKGFDPISVQQSWEGSTGKGVAGFLGAPIYGKTFAEREQLKADLKARRATPEWQQRAAKRKAEKAAQ